jgi:pimeloyl-ACP methyl ester carboxylesterase
VRNPGAAPPRDETKRTTDLYVERHSAGAGPPPIILVHGAPDRSTAFRHVVAHLREHDVIVYDRRGYGRSLGTTPARTMADHARDLLDIAAACPNPPVVVAHSFGSNPTMLAGTLRPDAFAAMGLWEPPLPWVSWWSAATKRYNAAIAASDTPGDDIEEMYRRLLGEDTWATLPDDVRAVRRAEGPAFQTDMASETSAPFAFADVAVPTLVGYGTETTAEHAYGARWLATTLPTARTQTITGTGHFAPRTHPREYAGFVRSVLPLAVPPTPPQRRPARPT